MRVGILGGTFDPLHWGHLILAQEAKEYFGLDRVLFIPNFYPPHKKGKYSLPQLRVKMLEEALKGIKNFKVSRLEVERGGISYTVDTLRALKKIYPRDRLYFIVGSDVVKDFFNTWRSPHQILRLSKLCVAQREDSPLKDRRLKGSKNVRFFKVTFLNISSSFIRERVSKGLSIRFYVPEVIERFIKRHRLYR